jgi:5-methylcytosine-specific restriction endonuclease McrA
MTFPRLLSDEEYKALCRQVLARDGYKCVYCGLRNNLHVHHIVYRSAGGPDTLENLVTLCHKHHEEVHRGNLVWEDE